jgi:hypothetical protein
VSLIHPYGRFGRFFTPTARSGSGSTGSTGGTGSSGSSGSGSHGTSSLNLEQHIAEFDGLAGFGMQPRHHALEGYRQFDHRLGRLNLDD